MNNDRKSHILALPLGGFERDPLPLEEIRTADPTPRPILLAGGTVITGSTIMGDWEKADVLIGGSLIVGVGPGLMTAAADDNMIVIDCTNCIVLPAKFNFSDLTQSGALKPGSAANIAVLRIADQKGTPYGPTLFRGCHLDILIMEGAIHVWDGKRLDEELTEEIGKMTSEPQQNHQRLGLWVDENGFVRQELLANGRYDEARGDRQSAYQGQYWINADRIDYLDDLGFWAFGSFEGNELLHAGYRFKRR